MRIRFFPVFVLAMFSSGACYRYVPIGQYQAPPGSEVRVVLTMDGEDEIRGTLGPGIFSLDGPLVRWDSEGLDLQTDLSISREGYPATTLTETIQLQPHHVARVELKELDGRRTAFFTAGVVGAAAAAIIAPS
ncbi:MAG: hypothetical protein KJN92_09235, partial [Gemmatimonadetes bacterium]|nr:hypothetical protein [Gemmatimonadota bacterium]